MVACSCLQEVFAVRGSNQNNFTEKKLWYFRKWLFMRGGGLQEVVTKGWSIIL